jgi:hypothetical protein
MHRDAGGEGARRTALKCFVEAWRLPSHRTDDARAFSELLK